MEKLMDKFFLINYREFMNFKMDQYMMENGLNIKCMERDYLLINIAKNIKVNL